MFDDRPAEEQLLDIHKNTPFHGCGTGYAAKKVITPVFAQSLLPESLDKFRQSSE
jgi:hypothetical protein